MTPVELKNSLRRIDPAAYPEVASYSRAGVYGHGDQLSPGGLYLAAKMARGLELREGDRVLDVGCGFGESSIFLAEHYGVEVVAVDLWVPSTTLARRFEERASGYRIVPLNLDITKPLPFADSYFDAIFCMTSFHYFGAKNGFLTHLLRYLKRGRRLSVSDTCFNEEVTADEVPAVYRESAPGNVFDSWEGETSTYHSPGWWARLFADSGLVDVIECDELEDGSAMWEDKLAYDLERSSWDENRIEQVRWKIDQILYGRESSPYFTFFLATLQKREPTTLKSRMKKMGLERQGLTARRSPHRRAGDSQRNPY